MATSPKLFAKAEEIRRVLSEPTVDLWKLRELALTEGGLVTDSLRKLAWPKLVGADQFGYNDSNSAAGSSAAIIASACSTSIVQDSSSNTIPDSLDHEQIERDVSRVTWHLLTGNQRSRNFQMKNKHRKRIAQLLKKKQRRLGDFLNLALVLSYHEEDGGADNIMGEEEARLRYYQGFHDVASIVLSALGGASLPVTPNRPNELADDGGDHQATHAAASSMGLTLACQVLLKLSHSHLRDAMRSNFLQLQSALKLIVMPLLGAFDSELHSHLYDCEMEPYFCLSWVITWFSHDVRDTALVKRLYDFFIVSHPLMGVYMSVAMMVHPLNRIEVLGADCDFACVHNTLANLPKNSSDVGWKYLPGEVSISSSGYITGEDDDASVDMSLQDQSLQDQSMDEGDDCSVISGIGGGRSGSRARVPFQELIDLSVSMMHKIPPRNLINLAQRYHTEITLKPLMAQSSTIALLQPPPAWCLASSTDSDWVLRQKIREEQGSTKLNRHQRKIRLKQQPQDTSTHPLLLEKPSIQAIIASGTGPDSRAEARKLRKKQRMMLRCAAVVVLSVLVALANNYFSRRPPPSLSSSHSKQQLTKDLLKKDSVVRLLLSEDDDLTDAAVVTSDVPLMSEDKEEVVEEVIITMQEKAEIIHDQIVEEISKKRAMADDYVEVENPAPSKEQMDARNPTDVENVNCAGKKKKKKPDSVCANDEASCVVEEHISSAYARQREATLQALLSSSRQFVVNLKTIKNNHSLDLHLDQIEEHFDYIMSQLMDTAKKGWFKIAPVLMNALQIGWRQIKEGWMDIAPVIEKELSTELEGGSLDWAEHAMKTWKKQEVLLKNQGKLIRSVVSNASNKLTKARKKKIRVGKH